MLHYEVHSSEFKNQYLGFSDFCLSLGNLGRGRVRWWSHRREFVARLLNHWVRQRPRGVEVSVVNGPFHYTLFMTSHNAALSAGMSSSQWSWPYISVGSAPVSSTKSSWLFGRQPWWPGFDLQDLRGGRKKQNLTSCSLTFTCRGVCACVCLWVCACVHVCAHLSVCRCAHSKFMNVKRYF